MVPHSNLPSLTGIRLSVRPFWVWDALIYAVVALLAWLTFGRGEDSPATAAQIIQMRLWFIASLLAYLLAFQVSVGRYFFQRPAEPVLVPVASFLLLALLLGGIGKFASVWAMLPLHLLWLGLAALRQSVARRLTPPLRLGMTSRPTDDLLRHLPPRRLQSAPIAPHNPLSLHQIDALIIAPDEPRPLQTRALAHAQLMNIPIITQRTLEEELLGKVSLDSIDEGWLQRSAFQSTYQQVKRFLDVTATLLALPLLLPLMAVVAAVVYFNSGRPVLFWQERVGQDGQAFQLVKFRTMTRDSERSGPAFAKSGDQRVTPVGAFLRKFRLDELPQFWNVLRGEMSIIGPRPEQWAFVAEFEESIPLYTTRHWVRPGITGWAQVNQGYTDSVGQTTEKLQYDFFYVKHCSLSLDALIVWKTIQTILTGFGSR